MTNFAKVENNIVTAVIVAEQNFIDSLPVDDSVQWIETSKTIRANEARIGFVYDSAHDVFYSSTGPFPSWSLNQTTWKWEAPVPIPSDASDTIKYYWVESTGEWVKIVAPAS